MNFFKNESGQTILEYALIIAVFILVILVLFPDVRGAVLNVFRATEDQLVVPTNS